jgi:serine/threonine protein phosphatase PrpC
MAEVDDDYDDESCSSSEGSAHRRHMLTLETHPPEGVSCECAPVPLATTITVSSRSDDVTTLGIEALSEVSHAIEVDSPQIASSKNAASIPVIGVACTSDRSNPEFHAPRVLPKFRDPKMCMWTSSHAANCPSEDRSSSLVNVLLRPLSSGVTNHDNRQLVRVSLWSVIDGHGGGCVATYASEVLLPHITANVARALKCEIVDRGVCTVNGELRDANALDLDGLIRTSDRNRANANSIQYRSQCDLAGTTATVRIEDPLAVSEEESFGHFPETGHNSTSVNAISSIGLPLVQTIDSGASVSSVKASAKTAAPLRQVDTHVGTHSPGEIASITQAITNSFLAVDEGWINSIDPIATHQTSCQSNGRWNAGACALVVFTVQRLEWSSAIVKTGMSGLGSQHQRDDTPHNEDAARRRMLDFAAKAKSAISVSSNSSILTDADLNNLSAFESEITETEDEGEESDLAQPSRKAKMRQGVPSLSVPADAVITTLGGCSCHAYKAQDAMLYTAHVGDCRAVLLGSAPPRTIKVGLAGDVLVDNPDTTDDESSHHSSDETECLSSSDHDAESSDEEDSTFESISGVTKTPPYLKYMRRPRRQSLRPRRDMSSHAPFVALPPLPMSPRSSSEDSESDSETIAPSVKPARISEFPHDSDDNSNESSLICGRDMSPPLLLAPITRPIDLTKDHSAYNPTEVSAVLRRCNNAPRAISASVGGGIKRVAGSLAVTRALGDAYLKTPKLSFQPYAKGCPYITAQPEVNVRRLSKDGDRVLILATDGVWERCSGEDVLRWIRNHSSERIARAERKVNRRLGSQAERMPQSDEKLQPESVSPAAEDEEDGSNSGLKRGLPCAGSVSPKKRKVVLCRDNGATAGGPGSVSTVADVIVRRVLNKVKRARNMTSLHALLSLPKGRARRSKHDDITASVVDLSAFV